MPVHSNKPRKRRNRLSPQARSLQARAAAHAMHARHDSRETSRPGRRAFLARFEREVDPDGVLPDGERRRRAEQAKRAHMLALAVRSAQSRRARAAEAAR